MKTADPYKQKSRTLHATLKRRAGRGESEHDHQKALFQWVDLAKGQQPELALLYAIPNGGLRRKGVAGKLKAEGVRPGVPDLCLAVARGNYHGLYIELKSGNNRATPAQTEWLEGLRRERYYATVCVGWEKARDVIAWYLDGAFQSPEAGEKRKEQPTDEGRRECPRRSRD